MIVGIGTDLCDTRRVQAALERYGERFALRILGHQELPVFRERQRQSTLRGVRFLASRFAVKEAFSKALGTGMRCPMTWHSCQTINAANGQPKLELHGQLHDCFKQRGWAAHVSIADEASHVLSFVLIETLS